MRGEVKGGKKDRRQNKTLNDGQRRRRPALLGLLSSLQALCDACSGSRALHVGKRGSGEMEKPRVTSAVEGGGARLGVGGGGRGEKVGGGEKWGGSGECPRGGCCMCRAGDARAGKLCLCLASSVSPSSAMRGQRRDVLCASMLPWQRALVNDGDSSSGRLVRVRAARQTWRHQTGEPPNSNGREGLQ